MDEWQPGFLQASPLFEPLRAVGQTVEKLARWPTLDDLNALLSPDIRTRSGVPVSFVPQGAKPRSMEERYEVRIHHTGEVQTRTENWHDLFNALVWLAFPRTKAAINDLHFRAAGGDGNRGALQDALTLFDESGVIVAHAGDELAGLLREHRWLELFWAQRKRVRTRMRFVVFGHSLYEKALRPYLGLTGKGMAVRVTEDVLIESRQDPARCLDGMLAECLGQADWPDCHALTPVPLLGVPGWWADNETPEFYRNAAYFREKRP